ncbi:MAG TPA: DMP19 family protein [Planctomycetaceae bacterium]|nr:DMP19 family protein [Planctomycetaceae bacterium]
MPPPYETVHVVVDDSTIADGNLAKILEPVWWRATIYEGPEEYERTLAQFSREQRLMFALRWYLSEVNNGGHHQFYSNSTGIVWRDAAYAFEALDLDEGVSIITDSAERLGGKPSLDRERRQMQMEKHAAGFRDLDDRLYALADEADIEQAMVAYIRNHPEAFYFTGEITRVVLPTRTPRQGNSLPPESSLP